MRFIFLLILIVASLIVLVAVRSWLSHAPTPLGRDHPPPAGMGGLRL
jgi:hypothetical protein